MIPFSSEIKQELFKTLSFAETHLKESTGMQFTGCLIMEKTVDKNTVPNEEKAEHIIKACCDILVCSVSHVKGKSRKRELVECRFIAATLIKNSTLLTLAEIGLCFSGRDHSSICHAINTTKDLVETNKAYAEKFNKCSEAVGKLNYSSGEKITITLKDLQ